MDSWTPLHAAAANGLSDMVRYKMIKYFQRGTPSKTASNLVFDARFLLLWGMRTMNLLLNEIRKFN
jgi:hypothetical protein